MEFVNELLSSFGLEAGSAGLIALVVILARAAGKVIPDDATGFLGIVRKVTKLIGLYSANRKSKGDPVG